MENLHHLEQMAAMVVAIPGLTPEMYWNLSHDETHALAKALKQRK